MIGSLLGASVHKYFDRTPNGRIANRFTKDLNMVDSNMGFKLGNTMINFVVLIGNIFIIVYVCGFLTLLPLLPIFAFLFYYVKYFLKPFREIARIESISKSPVLSTFS
jgi:ABC-type multidrug transport system fused ATPase/permease subunit